MRRGAVALIAAGLLLLMLPGGPRARAASVEATGWWWRAQTSSLPAPLPPPPTVGDDQLLVEGTPEGATAWAGVAYTLTEGETSPILTIVAADGEFVPESAVIVAFRASVRFAEATAGAWESRPLIDASASVRGIPDGPGRFVFPVAPLLSGPDLYIVLAPGIADGVPSTFSMRFPRPTVGSLQVTADAPTSPTVPTATSAPVPFAPVESVPLPDFPVAPQPAAVPVVPDPPALAPQDRRPNEVAIGQQPPRLPTQNVSNEVDNGTRAFGALLFLLGVAFAIWSSASPTPAMVGLGRFRREAPPPKEPGLEREPQTGGLGRFAKPRTEAAPPLT